MGRIAYAIQVILLKLFSKRKESMTSVRTLSASQD